MRKKIFSLLIVSTIILSAFSGCNNKSGTTENTTIEPTSITSVETTEATQSNSISEENTEAQVENTNEVQEESTEMQTEVIEMEPTESEQGSNIAEENTVNKIADVIKAAYGENYLPDMPMDSELIQQFFNIEPELYTEIFVETPMIGAQPDTLLIAKAAEGKLEDLKAKLDAYRERLINDTMQYPMNLPKINASQVVVNEDYIAFILLGAYNEDDMASEEEQAKFAQEQEQIGIDAFNKYFNILTL